MKDLKCSNPDCESNKGDDSCQEAFFNISVTVYSCRTVAEPMHKIPAEQFECGMCGAKAAPECEHCKDDEDGEGAWCVCGREIDEEDDHG